MERTERAPNSKEDKVYRKFQPQMVSICEKMLSFHRMMMGDKETSGFYTTNWINIPLMLETLSVFTFKSKGGSILYYDRTLLEKIDAGVENWNEGSTGGKVNLLLDWGWKDEYFLNDRESWGNEHCPYIITVNNDMGITISEMWEKGLFSDNYAEAYYQITELIKTGEIPEVEE